MARRQKNVLKYEDLIVPTIKALKNLGGSGSNEEIDKEIIKICNFPDSIVDVLHKSGSKYASARTELEYQAAWARTALRIYGAIENNGRSLWSVRSDYKNFEAINAQSVVKFVRQINGKGGKVKKLNLDDNIAVSQVDTPAELQPWRRRLIEILQTMDPFAFERLSQRILRECGFSDVKVTKKTNDGGIDGTGKLKINGIFSINVAFQCKRYKNLVGVSEIRDFRGSLPTSIEKGVLITTSSFSKAAIEEACADGKQQIDLIDGDEFVSKIAEYQVGVREVKTYEIDEKFFSEI